MFKKNEKTENHINQDNTQQIKQFYSMPELKQLIMRDISVLDDALAISGENTQLAYHISKQKGFANKYFGCTYKTNDEDFCVVSLPKVQDSLGKILTAFEPKDAEKEEQSTKDETSTENLDKIKQTNEEINKVLDESEDFLDGITNYWSSLNNRTKTQKPDKRGKGWKKVSVDGKIQLVYDVDKKRTREVLDDLDGKTHTYGGLMLAKDPIAYLDSIQIGDKIQYMSKKFKKVITEKVSNISVFKKACVPNSYVFYMRNAEKVTHKDFA